MRIIHRIFAVATAGAILMLTAQFGVSAPLKEVFTKDGKSVVGEVQEGEAIVRVKRRTGAAVTINRADVKEIKALRPEGDLKDEFKQKHAALPKNDNDARLSLGEWAEDRGLPAEALIVYEEAAKNNDRLAFANVARLQALLKVDPKTVAKTGPGTGPDVPAVSDRPDSIAVELDRNEIKRVQLREYAGEEVPRGTVSARDIKKSPRLTELNKIRDHKERFIAVKAAATEPGVLEGITIATEPAVLKAWYETSFANRRPIQTIVLERCATAKCHGGGTAKFQLLVKDAKNLKAPGVAYGNFEFLRTKFGGNMIRVNSATDSGLLKYGLSEADKKKLVFPPKDVLDHPAVWKNTDEKDYIAILEWIGKLNPLPPTVGPAAAGNNNP